MAGLVKPCVPGLGRLVLTPSAEYETLPLVPIAEALPLHRPLASEDFAIVTSGKRANDKLRPSFHYAAWMDCAINDSQSAAEALAEKDARGQ
jgi:hypothetical protein